MPPVKAGRTARGVESYRQFPPALGNPFPAIVLAGRLIYRALTGKSGCEDSGKVTARAAKKAVFVKKTAFLLVFSFAGIVQIKF